MTYEGKPSSNEEANLCSVHDAYEMFHTCAGGPGEPLGYCAKWDGKLVGTHEVKGKMYGGEPTCKFED